MDQIEPVVDAVEIPAAAEIEKEATSAVQAEGQENAQEVKPEPPKDDALPKGVQKRIDRAVKQKYEAEARARVLEERLNQIEQRIPQQPKSDGEPRLEQFDNIEDYVSAKARFIAKAELNETLTARDRAVAEEKAQAAQHQSAESWAKRLALATAEMPDFEDVVASSDVNFRDPVVLEVIKASDIGPKIAYYLASNSDEADEIAQMTGANAIRAIARIEAKLEYGKASITKAPPPIEPNGTKAKAVKSPDDMSDTEFAAWRKRHIAAR